MKIAEIQELTAKELLSRKRELREEIFNLRVQQQSGQLDSRLPTARQLGDRAFKIRPFQFELTGDFTALPVGLTTVPHQEFLSGFAGTERVVLTQVADLQFRMSRHFACIEFFFTE